MKRTSITEALAIGAVAALALGLTPLAKAEDTTGTKPCSAETIKGAFARTDKGFVINPNGVALPLAGVSLMTFDGSGTWTSSGFASVNGTQPPATSTPSVSTGTYTVNSDCTGEYHPDVATPGRTGQAFFVIVDRGNEIQILPRDQGAALICVARRVSPVARSKD
jgi:hypothetical protein